MATTKVLFRTLQLIALLAGVASTPASTCLAAVARIHLISTTDMHGYIIPTQLKSGLLTGGVDYIAGYYKAARTLDPETILVDSGDMFQGTIVSNQGEGASVTKFFNYAGYTAAAIGNHEFDFGPAGPDTIVHQPSQDPLGALKARIGASNFSFLAANICSLDEDPCTDAWKYKTASFVQPYLIKKVHGVNVGIIGLTTADTPETTMRQNVARLKFFPLHQTLDRYVPEMKAKGADIIVVIAHSGGFCPQNLCNPSDELFSTLDRVADSTRSAIAVVLAGHTHNYLNTDYHGVKVLIAGKYGQSFAHVTLEFDRANGKVAASGTAVDFCQQVFPDTKKCSAGSGAVIAPAFQGIAVLPDPAALKAVEKDLAQADATGKVEVGRALFPLTIAKPESTMGDLMADALRNCFSDAACKGTADIALQNNGGIRSDIPAGIVTYKKVFEVMPFDNYVATVKLTGEQLRDLLVLWFEHEKALPQVSGLTIKLNSQSQATRTIHNSANASRTLTDPIVSIEPFDSGKTYTVVMADFLATGGGGLDFLLASLKPQPIVNYDRKFRDAIVDYFKASPAGVNYKDLPPRIIDQK